MKTGARDVVDPGSIRAVRPGHGANCSSIGSVVDTLFVTALLGGGIFAAVVAALGSEPIDVIGEGPPRGSGSDDEREDTEPEAR
jgi:hypothetical protein